MATPNRRLQAARRARGWSRQRLADEIAAWVQEHTGIERHPTAEYVGKLERGAVSWPNDSYRAAMRALFGAHSDDALGFWPYGSSTPAAILEEMERRDLLRGGIAAVASTATFAAMLDGIANATPTGVGIGDIARIREAATVYTSLDRTRGGGFALDGALAQLRRATEYLDAPCPQAIEGDLFMAVGELADTVGYMAFDAGQLDAARRVFTLAARCAHEAGDAGLRLRALVHLAELSMWHERPDDAVALISAGLDQPGRLSPAEHALGLVALAMAHGCRGDTAATVDTVARADDIYDDSDLPARMSWYTRTWHDSLAGRALYDATLATGHDAGAADRLRAGIAQTAFARSRATGQLRLATVLLLTHDPEEGAAVGLAGLEGAGPIESARIARFTRTLHLATSSHAGRPEVAELRARTADALLA